MSVATAPSPPPNASERPRAHHQRRPALPAAHGEPAIWVMGSALVIAVVMILGILALIIVQGSQTFWPRPVHRLALSSGEVVLGIPTDHDEAAKRTLYRVGNRDIGQQPFRWINAADITTTDTPTDVLLLERTDWGIWLGEPQAIIELDGTSRTTLAEGPHATIAKLRELQPAIIAAEHNAEHRTEHELGAISRDINNLRLEVKEAELQAREHTTQRPPLLSWLTTGLLAAGAVAAAFASRRIRSTPNQSLTQRSLRAGARAALFTLAIAAALFALLENPTRANTMTPERLAAIKHDAATRITSLQKQYQATQSDISTRRTQNNRTRLLITEPTTGHIAPTRQSAPDDPLQVSQIVRAVQPNALSTSDKLGVYFSRWWEFLSAKPRAQNTEGGVFPVIVGTVTLTILLAVAVVPLGVVAALYLREYARQGPLVSLIRIAVNNLAGVPSVVYGIFGLGFFAYSLGAYIDTGPSSPTPATPWWWGIIACAVLVSLALALAVYAKGIPNPRTRTRVQALIGLGWLAALILAIWAIWTTPYFGGFFREKLPTSTFNARGILWASLTLALLTLPVVIVATEEAIAAVPRSVREGSYGAGASKWQTVRRIVLPQALPGIMTGAILAMARGAGEVAPLMLVGAVKSAPELPIDSEFPFIHAERSFMHLGFHIFDLGFQSPDSKASTPLLWTTTLLLILIVLALNLTAIIIRSRLRAKVINASV
ncbi:MAG TPA: ABC transporter permease subunit [Phycisphaerales bacterium]|nr:ABC transporter permease subunit [Phycisphaerales bacterium]